MSAETFVASELISRTRFEGRTPWKTGERSPTSKAFGLFPNSFKSEKEVVANSGAVRFAENISAKKMLKA